MAHCDSITHRFVRIKAGFWPLPSEFHLGSGKGAAGGIALVNAIGNFGGFVGPYILGFLKDSTGTYEAGMYFLSACALISAVVAFFTVHRTRVPQYEGSVSGDFDCENKRRWRRGPYHKNPTLI